MYKFRYAVFVMMLISTAIFIACSRNNEINEIIEYFYSTEFDINPTEEVLIYQDLYDRSELGLPTLQQKPKLDTSIYCEPQFQYIVQFNSKLDLEKGEISIFRNNHFVRVRNKMEAWQDDVLTYLHFLAADVYYPQIFFKDERRGEPEETLINNILQMTMFRFNFDRHDEILDTYKEILRWEDESYWAWMNIEVDYDILKIADELISFYIMWTSQHAAGRLQAWDHHITIDLMTGRLKDLFDIVYAESILAAFEEGRYTVFTGSDRRSFELDDYLSERYREIIEENLPSNGTHNTPHADVRNFGIDEDYIYVFVPTWSTHGWHGRLILQIAHGNVVFR